MVLKVEAFNRPDWTPLPYYGCSNAEAKGLAQLKDVSIALLRFGSNATIHEHAADIDIDVFCLEG